jgi:hypothetical protein
MSIRILLLLLTSAAVLLGQFVVSGDADGPLSFLVPEKAEDLEEDDEREDLFLSDDGSVVETAFHVSEVSIWSTFLGVPIVRGHHNERGPPVG